ncbi:glycosyltransferase [Pedobacter sp.]|uniref:glycosyltransferase n=1 Tax=Pedobacter sp. TaxID=1411316 RepID=UPI003D7FAB5F
MDGIFQTTLRYQMTIIIPVYNEEENLDRLISTFMAYFAESTTKSKVLFIDDGSTDHSFKKIEMVCAQEENFEYIKFSRNFGLSSAIKAGIDHINTPLTGYIDADLQTSPFDFERLLNQMDGYTMILGYRGNRKDTFSKRLQSKIANTLRRYLINDGIIDTGCPLKIIKTAAAKKIPFFDGMHRFIPALILLQKGSVKQVNVQHFPRLAGKSKFTLFNRSIKPLQDTFAFRWMRKRYINYAIELIKLKNVNINQ